MRLLLLLPFFLLLSCDKNNPNPMEDLMTTVQYHEINGVDPDLLSLDVYYNSNEDLKPVVIYVHGGGWSIGDKASQLENKINLFRSLDYVFVSINYRLSPFPFELSNSDRIKFPDHNNDVTKAIKWVHDNISEYGGNNSKIALLGHSAGAHLVSLTGTYEVFLRNADLDFSNIKGIAAIDTEGYHVKNEIENGNSQDMYINAFGTDMLDQIAASPILNVSNTSSQLKFFIAKRGTAERIGKADDFITVLENNGVAVSQVDGSIYDHSGINDAIGKTGETVITTPLKSFFEECFQ